MAVPLDAIRAFHNAFRKDMAAMDSAAYAAAAGRGDLSLLEKRHVFFNEILAWHARGEELAVFPGIEKVAPLVAEPYERDHRGLDALSESLHKAVQASDLLATARATAAFNFHLHIHLDKEDAHLYRILNERVSLLDQGAILQILAQQVPQERFPETVRWLFPLLGPNDQENMIRIWQQAFPEPVLAAAVKQVQAAIGDEWAEMIRRIPELK